MSSLHSVAVRTGLSVVAVGVLVSGCAAQPAGQRSGSAAGSATHLMADGTTMAGGSMTDAATGPSASASMICSSEIAAAVQRNFGLGAVPRGRGSWSASEQTYRCVYPLAHSSLTLTVKDLSTPGPGRAWFDALRARLGGAHTITGLSNFGFPAFRTPQGDVAFLKDDKTLWVDAEGVSKADLPSGFTRSATAYGVAAAVIGCWTE